MDINILKKVISEKYLINILKIEKNIESTVGNVYIINTNDEKYVLKIYDDLNHTKSMSFLHTDLSNKFNIPKIKKNKSDELYTIIDDNKYLVLYSFLEGVQICELNIVEALIKKIAKEIRRLHDLTEINNYKLKEISFLKDPKLKRKSLLHFDLTKNNIFYDNGQIGIIDFDDAKYGHSVYDVAILILLFFISKKRGIDKTNLNLFIDTYYGENQELKNEEIKYINDISISWINQTLDTNNFHISLKDSFETKKKLIIENLMKKELIPFNRCINQEVYEMYQDIPYEELGSINKLNGVSYEEFINISNQYTKEETIINEELNTTTSRYILYIDDIPIGEVGIRTTINDFWKNKGSHIFYKIRKSYRKKGYGNIILKLALEKCKELGFKQIRINCDNENIASKKIILKNGGKKDIENYKTKDGYSTSYLIDLEV